MRTSRKRCHAVNLSETMNHACKLKSFGNYVQAACFAESHMSIGLAATSLLDNSEFLTEGSGPLISPRPRPI